MGCGSSGCLYIHYGFMCVCACGMLLLRGRGRVVKGSGFELLYIYSGKLIPMR